MGNIDIKSYYTLPNDGLGIGSVVTVKDNEICGVFIISGVRVSKDADGGTVTKYRLNDTDTWLDGEYLEPFVDINTVDKMIDWVYGHVNDYLVNDKLNPTDPDRLICKAEMFEDLKFYMKYPTNS